MQIRLVGLPIGLVLTTSSLGLLADILGVLGLGIFGEVVSLSEFLWSSSAPYSLASTVMRRR